MTGRELLNKLKTFSDNILDNPIFLQIDYIKESACIDDTVFNEITQVISKKETIYTEHKNKKKAVIVLSDQHTLI